MGEHREDHADRHGFGGPDQLDLSGYGVGGDSLWEYVDVGGGLHVLQPAGGGTVEEFDVVTTVADIALTAAGQAIVSGDDLHLNGVSSGAIAITSGDLDVDIAGGNLNISTQVGDITADATGKVAITSASGTIDNDILIEATDSLGVINVTADGHGLFVGNGVVDLYGPNGSSIDLNDTVGTGDLNINLVRDWNVRLGNDFNIGAPFAGTNNDFNASFDNDFNFQAGRDFNIGADRDFNIIASNDVFIGQAGNAVDELEVNAALIDLNSSGLFTLDTGGNLTLVSGGTGQFSASSTLTLASSTDAVLISSNNLITIGSSTGEQVRIRANNATPSTSLPNSSVVMWLNQGSNLLTFAVKYSDGTTKTGTVALS